MKDMNAEVYRLGEGDSLPELQKQVLQDAIDRYARASGDYNPIHIDQEFASRTPLGGTIAHGMLILAYVTQMIGHTFGRQWNAGGSLKVRFKNPARPGDTLTIGGKVRSVTDREHIRIFTCEVRCSNQNDDTVITGEISAGVALP